MKSFQPYSNYSAVVLSACISFLVNFIFLLGLIYMKTNGAPANEVNIVNLPYLVVLFNAVSNFLLFYLIYTVNFRIMKINSNRKHLHLLLIITATLLLTLIISPLLSNLQLALNWREFHHPHRFVFSNLTRDIFMSIIIIFTTQLIYLWSERQKTMLENQQLMTENIHTRYQALKNQVNPHFLFNSLNTLNSLIGSDDEKAHEYVQQLSAVFRYTLQDKEIIRLNEEMDFVQSYLHLMKIRYGNNLQIVTNIADQYINFNIIPLGVQTLVENAIKHNVISNKYPLTIYIESTQAGTIRVYNLIQPKKDMEEGSGIGLANLAERCRLLLHKDISISNTHDTFSVEIPLSPEMKNT